MVKEIDQYWYRVDERFKKIDFNNDTFILDSICDIVELNHKNFEKSQIAVDCLGFNNWINIVYINQLLENAT